MPVVHVTDHVKDELERLKDAEEHTSYDSAIRALLQNYEVDNGD